MPARSHGTDEPPPGEPHEPDREAPEDDLADAVPTDSAPAADGAPEADLDDAEVASRWDALVTQLRVPADPRAWAPDPEVEEAEDHFVPPDPGPVLSPDPFLRLTWLVVVGIPLLAVLAAAFWQDPPTWLLQAAGAVFVAGIVVLVRRMPRDRAEEDDPGSGAVV